MTAELAELFSHDRVPAQPPHGQHTGTRETSQGKAMRDMWDTSIFGLIHWIDARSPCPVVTSGCALGRKILKNRRAIDVVTAAKR